MSHLYLTVMNILEPLYYVGGIVVGCTAMFAVKQLRLTQEQIRLAQEESSLRYKREAAQRAATLCDRFASSIIPLHTESRANEEKFGAARYDGKVLGFDRPSAATIPREWIEQWNTAQQKAAKNNSRFKTMQLLNELEAIAIYFTGGIASEETAFPSIGHIFCAYVRDYYPLLVSSHLSGDKFSYCIKLYNKWISRIESSRLLEDKQRIDTRLQSLDTSPIPIISM